MKFIREFTPDEIKLFNKGDLHHEINSIIDRAINQRIAARDDATVESRILKVMSKTKPMTVGAIMDAHNALLFLKPISLNYTRSVLSNMLKAGLISRPGHGQYVKGGK